MRPLHWTKVPIAEVAHSIWAQLPAYEADEEALKRLFTIKVVPKKQQSAANMVAQSANKKVMPLDPNPNPNPDPNPNPNPNPNQVMLLDLKR